MCAHNGLTFPCSACSVIQPCFSPIPPFVRSCDCNSTGCLFQLDTDCVIYHKNNNVISGLVNLALPNGSTAGLIFDTIDSKLGQLNVASFTLPCLRTTFNIPNVITLQAFSQAVDSVLCLLNSEVIALQSEVGVPLTANDSTTIHFSTSGTLQHTLTGNVKISSTGGNRITSDGTGIFAAPQNLSLDVPTRTLSISGGNSVNLSAVVASPSGYLGNVTADPATPNDGNYWFRTDLSAANGLRIQVNGSVRTIPTT